MLGLNLIHVSKRYPRHQRIYAWDRDPTYAPTIELIQVKPSYSWWLIYWVHVYISTLRHVIGLVDITHNPRGRKFAWIKGKLHKSKLPKQLVEHSFVRHGHASQYAILKWQLYLCIGSTRFLHMSERAILHVLF